MVVTIESAEPKKPTSEVGYEHPAQGKNHCALCKYFEVRRPLQCLKVQGTIHAGDWCKLLDKK